MDTKTACPNMRNSPSNSPRTDKIYLSSTAPRHLEHFQPNLRLPRPTTLQFLCFRHLQGLHRPPLGPPRRSHRDLPTSRSRPRTAPHRTNSPTPLPPPAPPAAPPPLPVDGANNTPRPWLHRPSNNCSAASRSSRNNSRPPKPRCRLRRFPLRPPRNLLFPLPLGHPQRTQPARPAPTPTRRDSLTDLGASATTPPRPPRFSRRRPPSRDLPWTSLRPTPARAAAPRPADPGPPLAVPALRLLVLPAAGAHRPWSLRPPPAAHRSLPAGTDTPAPVHRADPAATPTRPENTTAGTTAAGAQPLTTSDHLANPLDWLWTGAPALLPAPGPTTRPPPRILPPRPRRPHPAPRSWTPSCPTRQISPWPPTPPSRTIPSSRQ